MFPSGDFITHLEGKKVKGVNDVLTAIGVEADKTITLGIRKQSGEAKTVRILTVPEHGRIKSK
jgi:C-terminal processing protease CtpA/Prc